MKLKRKDDNGDNNEVQQLNSVDFSLQQDKSVAVPESPFSKSPQKSTMMQQSNDTPTLTESYDSHGNPDSQKDYFAANFYSGPLGPGSSSFDQMSASSSKKDSGCLTASSLISSLPFPLQEQYLSLSPDKQQEADGIFRGAVDGTPTDPTQWFESFLNSQNVPTTSSPTFHGLEFGPTLDSYNVTRLSDEGSDDKLDLHFQPPPGFLLDQQRFSYRDLPQGYLRGLEETLLESATNENEAILPEFQLLPQQQATFDALSVDDQADALDFCHEFASQQQQQPIRNPAAFFSRVLDNYIRHGNVPPFELPKGLARTFQQLPPAKQEEARTYCLKYATNIIANGRPIRNPSSYYSKVFRSFWENRTESQSNGAPNNNDDGDDDDDDDSEAAPIEPAFILPRNRQKIFQFLPPKQRTVAEQHCKNAARSVVAAGHSIRNPAAYYGKVFDSIRDDLATMVASSVIDDASQSTFDDSVDGVPAFALQASAMRMFQSLSRELQEKAMAFCIHQAQSELASGKRIRSPTAFYSVSFQKFRHQLHKDDESQDSASLPPPFSLGDNHRTQLEQLDESTRRSAVEFCKDSAIAVLETGRTIRNPTAFYSKNLERFLESQSGSRASAQPVEQIVPIPEFSLPESQRRVFDALSSAQRDSALQYCKKSAESYIQGGSQIGEPNAFFGWVFHRFFEDQTLPCCPPDIMEDAPGSTSAHQDNSFVAPSVEPSLLSAEILQRELNDTRSMLETKTQACNHLSNLLKQEQERSKQALQQVSTLREHLAEQEGLISDLRLEKAGLQARSKLLAQLEQRSKSDLLTIASLKDELKRSQDKYNEESETYRKMTSTFASVSDELCRERSARREMEGLLAAERLRLDSLQKDDE